MFDVPSEEKLLFSIGWLKQNLINVGDVFVYNYPVYKVTLDCKHEYYVCTTNEQNALDEVIDHLEIIKELDIFVYTADELEEMDDAEIENLTVVGNHCYNLNCSFRIEEIKCL